MDQNVAWLGALGAGMVIVAMFLSFSYDIGALQKLGREPSSSREFLILCLAVFLPGGGCLLCLGLTVLPGALAHPAVLAFGMGAVVAGSRECFMALRKWAAPGQKSGRG